MTATRDPDRLIGAFLAEGRTELPDRTYDEVRERIDQTRQRVVIGPWREPHMPVFARVALAAAAVLIAAVVGVNLLGGGGPPVGGPDPSPSASPVSSPIAVPPEGGDLEPGTYVMEAGALSPVHTTLTLPPDWEVMPGGIFFKGATGAGDAPDAALAFWTVENVYGDVCRWLSSTPASPTGPTVDDLVTALGQQEGRDASAPTDVTVGGYRGKKIDLVLHEFDFGTCDQGQPASWRSEGGTGSHGGYIYRGGQRNSVYVIDVDGERVVVDTMYLPGTSDADVAELEQIVASVRFEP
jgi:hypothetical protein